jgi:hypothetical protein
MRDRYVYVSGKWRCFEEMKRFTKKKKNLTGLGGERKISRNQQIRYKTKGIRQRNRGIIRHREQENKNLISLCLISSCYQIDAQHAHRPRSPYNWRIWHQQSYTVSSMAATNGHRLPLSPVSPSEDVSSSPDIFNASSVAEIKATLSHLHNQEASVTARLDALVTSQKDLSRELGRLDLMRANIGTHASTTRSISHGMLSEAAGTADRISSAVRRLDLEKSRVKATLEVVEQVAELKACALGVAGSMGAPQDWEKAASYLHRAAQIPASVVNGAFAAEMVPTAEVPDPPSVTLDNAAESLCGLFLREFEKAVKENDGAKVTRFFKLFPLIGRSEVGLDVYGRYVCQGVAAKARANLNGATGGVQTKDGFFYANAFSRLFEHIAQIVDGHGGLVEHHYGPHKMGRVIERLQIEADVQGGIILDTWGDERHVDRKLMDIKSYAFTFLVQSFLPAQRPGPPHSSSPAPATAAADEEGVDMKEIDGVLNEMGIMLSRWSLYCRFLADKCNVSATLPLDINQH